MHSPGPPPPSAGATPSASLLGSQRRSTAPAAAAAGATGGRGATARRLWRGRGGAWRAAAPGRAELETDLETASRDVIRVWPRRAPRPAQPASMRLSPAHLPPTPVPSRPTGHPEFPSRNWLEPPPPARRGAGREPGPPPPAAAESTATLAGLYRPRGEPPAQLRRGGGCQGPTGGDFEDGSGNCIT